MHWEDEPNKTGALLICIRFTDNLEEVSGGGGSSTGAEARRRERRRPNGVIPRWAVAGGRGNKDVWKVAARGGRAGGVGVVVGRRRGAVVRTAGRGAKVEGARG